MLGASDNMKIFYMSKHSEASIVNASKKLHATRRALAFVIFSDDDAVSAAFVNEYKKFEYHKRSKQ